MPYYHAVRPMLAMGNQGAGGDIWLMSTPNGKRGFLWEEWSNYEDEADDPWFRLTVPATDCPRFRPQFLAREKRSLGERAFNQEYLCQFTDAEEALFREELVRQAFRDDIKASIPRWQVDRGTIACTHSTRTRVRWTSLVYRGILHE